MLTQASESLRAVALEKKASLQAAVAGCRTT